MCEGAGLLHVGVPFHGTSESHGEVFAGGYRWKVMADGQRLREGTAPTEREAREAADESVSSCSRLRTGRYDMLPRGLIDIHR